MNMWRWVTALSVLLAGCSGENGAETGSERSGRPLVYASNYPLQYFAQRISASLVDVRLPVPAGEDPAFWKPAPEDVLTLQKADLIVLNGASYESWLKNVSLPTSRLVDTSEGFKEQFIAQEEATTHSHGPGGEHEHSATAFTTWLDLALAVEQARAIKDAFSTRWPEHKGQFEAQFEKLARELEDSGRGDQRDREGRDRRARAVLASCLPVLRASISNQWPQRPLGAGGNAFGCHVAGVDHAPAFASGQVDDLGGQAVI